MGLALTNGYDLVFELAEPAFTRQLVSLPALQRTVRTAFTTPLLSGRARIHLSHPAAEFKSPPAVSERITISLDVAGSALIVTHPKQGVVPIEGTLALGGRVRVISVGTTGSRQVVLDFTTNNGGPDVLTLTFPANTTAMDTGLQSLGITPNAGVRSLVQQMILDQARTWIAANLATVPIGLPTPIAPAPAGAFAVTQLDAHVVEDPASQRDALVVAMATCGGANPALDPTLFTSTTVPTADDAAVTMSNATLLRCIVCPTLATGLGIPATSFAPPCTLTAPVAITVTGVPFPVTITTLTATVGAGGLINVRGTMAVTSTAFSVTGTFGVDIALTLPATPPPGGPAIVPVVTVLPSTASITLAWWVWALAALLLPIVLGSVGTIAVLVAAAIANGIANSSLATALTTGVAGALPAPGAIPLGPLAASFSPRTLTLDDLRLTGAITLAAADTNPRLLVVDSLDQAIDVVQLSPRYEGSDTTWSLYVHNRGTQPLTLSSITTTDDPTNAFRIPDATLPLTFAGGQTRTVPCRFHPAAAGRYVPKITLNSDDAFGPVEADLEAEAVALPPHGLLDVQPPALPFGQVLAKSTTSLNLTLANVGNASLDVTNVALTSESPAGWFLLPWSWPGTIAAGQSRTLPITFLPPQTGSASASLGIDMSSAAGLYTEHHAIPLTGTAGAPVIRLAPTPLDFGALAAGASATEQLTVHNDGDMDLVVQAIYRTAGQPDFWFDPSLAFPLTVPAGGQVALDVTTTAAPWPGYVNANEFEFASNDPVTPGAVVLCRCATAGPRIEVQPDFIAFGRPPAVPALATITIYNRGSSQLDVPSVHVTAPPFTLVGLPVGPFSVPAAGQQQFQVQFMPPKTGQFAAYVQIQSNDALRPSVSVGMQASW